MKKSAARIAVRLTALVTSVLMLLTSCANGGVETTDITTDKPTEAVTTEPDTVTETDEETTAAPEPVQLGTVELYQLVPETSSLMMSYVIVTPNRKIVVIDGGIDGTGLNAKTYLQSAIRAILGLEDGAYFEVEAWFLSHAHKDHYNELAKMLTQYTAESNYKINNFYFDFPKIGEEWKSAAGDSDHDLEKLGDLKKGMDNYYSINGFTGIKGADIPEDKWTKPEDAENYYYELINGAVINADAIEQGLTIDVDGVTFRILMTWCAESKYVNSTSVINRMEYGGHTVLFLGDCAADEWKRLLEKYDPEQMKSEYVQMGHHGQGGPDREFYDAIDAAHSKRLWPTPAWVWSDPNTYRIGETREWMGLPVEAADFKREGHLSDGNDFVAGCYKKYPSSAAYKVSKWTASILNAQRVAVFEGPMPQ
ncbi:MAG: hypothetical protein J6330_06600 [Clostridia bacterium]|nr:hypothetical protein [Clostridia bacterium]